MHKIKTHRKHHHHHKTSHKRTSFNNITDPRFAQLSESPTVAINQISIKRKSQLLPSYGFGFGQSPFPVPKKLKEALVMHAAEKAYLPTSGLRPLRAKIGDYMNRKMHGGEHVYEDDLVIVGPGSKELIFLTQVALNDTCDVHIPVPSFMRWFLASLANTRWVSYAPQSILSRHNHHFIQHDGSFKVKAGLLDEHFKEFPGLGVLILCYPNNPTGLSYTKEELQDIAHVCRKHNKIVIADEIYHELSFYPEHQKAHIASYYPEGTIVSSGISKWLGAGGWRLGFFAFPRELKELKDAVVVAASESFTSASSPIQYSCTHVYPPTEDIFAYRQKSIDVLKPIGQQIFSYLEENGIPTTRPEGGFYTYPNFVNYKEALAKRGIKTSADLTKQLIEDTGVALLPGISFGEEPEMLTARLAYVDFNGSEALRDVHSLSQEKFLKRHTHHMMEGLDHMVKWLQK